MTSVVDLNKARDGIVLLSWMENSVMLCGSGVLIATIEMNKKRPWNLAAFADCNNKSIGITKSIVERWAY